MRTLHSDTPKLLAVSIFFVLCIAPTFISYQPYRFQWDDSDYFARAIIVTNGLQAKNLRLLRAGMVSAHPPIMTLLGIPWGRITSWNEAGKCFVSLAGAISILAALSLYLLLRAGIKPLYLIGASLCLLLALGPLPQSSPIHCDASSFLADGLFAWTAFLAVLLIPYEAKTTARTTIDAILKGALWAATLSLGAMTKLSFFYFYVSIPPVLFFITARRNGRTRALTTLVTFFCCATPYALYLMLWGRPAFALAKSSSFGGVADLYYVPLLNFIESNLRQSPGLLLLFLCTVAALLYSSTNKHSTLTWPVIIALLIMVGYLAIVLKAPNREIRFVLPVIVAAPFLVGLLASGDARAASPRFAAGAALLVFSGLLAASWPTQFRADWRSLEAPNAVLQVAARANAESVLLATDSPTLNYQLMSLAAVFSPRTIYAGTMAYNAIGGASIEQDFHLISRMDVIVFQDREVLNPPFTNQRVAQYESFTRQIGLGPIRIAKDTSVYFIRSR